MNALKFSAAILVFAFTFACGLRSYANPPVGIVTVTGRVLVEPNGHGAVGVTVVIQTGLGYGVHPVTTDGGRYSFELWGDKANKPVSIWIDPESRLPGTWTPKVDIRVSDQDATVPDLHLSLHQSISGIARDAQTGDPVAGAKIRTEWIPIETDESGRYFMYVRPGKAEIACSGSEQYYADGNDRRDGTPWSITVRKGEQASDVNFWLDRAPSFTGTVVYPDGRPAANAEVGVELLWSGIAGQRYSVSSMGDSRRLELRTDKQGKFTGYVRRPRPSQKPGMVNVNIIAWLPDRSMGGFVHTETTTPDPRLDPITIVIDECASATVRILNAKGQPITDPYIEPNVTGRQGFPFYDSRQVNTEYYGQGRYLITGIIPGLEHLFRIMHDRKGFLTERLILAQGEHLDVGTIVLDYHSISSERLRELLKHLAIKEEHVPRKVQSAQALGDIDPNTEEAKLAIPALLKSLRSETYDELVGACALSLGRLGAEAAVPDLIRCLQEGGYVTRWRAAEALGVLSDKAGIPSLRHALSDPAPNVSKSAAEAIEKIERAS